MEIRRVHLVDAFAEEPLSGNVAGVVPDADGLADEQLRAIAAELGASETAFLFPSTAADRRIRYFTPETEVDLCGHATIASHGLLSANGELAPGVHTLETNDGVLEIELEEDGTVWMAGEEPSVRQVDPDYDRLADALGIDPAALSDVGADLPTAVASTGLAFLVVPVAFLEGLGGATPDFEAIEELSAAHDVAGVYAFTFDTLSAESTLHARMFAPAVGVPEDPVTGTASGACGAYLDHVGAFDGDAPEELRFEQGHFLDRGGIVRVRLDDGIHVGGTAVESLEGSIAVPDADEDDIIEI
ncbi:phenazine biosynthesis protein PhzF family [Halalkaliarchaeum desulfuricum]|uniref:Phenazine biosynthesis protein PhzF family n=1 Tax=Halalkaliarchaeum desulfuricum TaxID=2055893 RepID=A0A343TH62_9EURY|nr:PhzF family phenazine biosynthesis protein [Halalkaliarchaeum desulfuricum]AUX08434.1 phenazine biosynthesis protein PhzF family [Halalkaliarchaeum desulfuricum]